MNYDEIGRKVKEQYPQYADMDNYDLGKSYYEKYLSSGKELVLYDPPAYEPLNYTATPPNVPKFFVGTRTEHKKKQVEYVAAAHTLDSTIVEGDFSRRHTEESHRQRLETTRIQHKQEMLNAQLLVATTENALAIAPQRHAIDVDEMHKAAAKGVNVSQLQEANAQVLMIDGKVKEKQELDKAEQANKRELEKIRVTAYSEEAQVDLNFTLAQQLIPHETIILTNNRLQRLILEKAKIEAMQVPLTVKQELLAAQEEVIEAFKKDLRDQMARHLLKEADGKDTGATDAATDSPSGY